MAYWGEIVELEKPVDNYVVYECPDIDNVDDYKDLDISFVSDITLNNSGFHLEYNDDVHDALLFKDISAANTFCSVCACVTNYERDFHVMRITRRYDFTQID